MIGATQIVWSSATPRWLQCPAHHRVARYPSPCRPSTSHRRLRPAQPCALLLPGSTTRSRRPRAPASPFRASTLWTIVQAPPHVTQGCVGLGAAVVAERRIAGSGGTAVATEAFSCGLHTTSAREAAWRAAAAPAGQVSSSTIVLLGPRSALPAHHSARPSAPRIQVSQTSTIVDLHPCRGGHVCEAVKVPRVGEVLQRMRYGQLGTVSTARRTRRTSARAGRDG
jgi:hypothetical protein